MLNSNRHRSVAFLSVSGIDDSDHHDGNDSRSESENERTNTDDAAWFIRWADQKGPAWKLTNSPSLLSETVDEVQQQGGSICSVEFGRYGEWVLRYAD